MPTLVDSSILVDVLRGHRPAIVFLSEARRRDRIVSVTPVRSEILGGVRDDEVRRTFDLLRLVEWIDVTVELADVAGALQRRYHPRFSGIDVVDYLLAAVAFQVDGVVATLNVRDFPMFPGLKPPY